VVWWRRARRAEKVPIMSTRREPFPAALADPAAAVDALLRMAAGSLTRRAAH